jgi:hypothetical protein
MEWGKSVTERSNDYPTDNTNDPEGYRVVFDGTGPDENGWTVLRYDGAHTRQIHHRPGLTEDDAHAMAERLAAPRCDVSAPEGSTGEGVA